MLNMAPRAAATFCAFSVLIHPVSRYSLRGLTGTRTAQLASAPCSAVIFALRRPVRPWSATLNWARPLWVTVRQPDGRSLLSSSKEALGIKLAGSAAGAVAEAGAAGLNDASTAFKKDTSCRAAAAVAPSGIHLSPLFS